MNTIICLIIAGIVVLFAFLVFAIYKVTKKNINEPNTEDE
jgi:hypothetical protein